MSWPVIVRLKPYSSTKPRWHLASFLSRIWVWGACGRIGGLRTQERMQITYGEPTCKWCKTLRMVGEKAPSGRLAKKLEPKTGDEPDA